MDQIECVAAKQPNSATNGKTDGVFNSNFKGDLVLKDELRCRILDHLAEVSGHLKGKPKLAQSNYELICSLMDMETSFTPNSATCSLTESESPRQSARITQSNLLVNIGGQQTNLTDSRSDAILTMKINNLDDFLTGGRQRKSEIFVARELAWFITSQATKQPNGQTGVSFYLTCQPDEYGFWYCQAKMKYRLINQKSDQLDYMRSLAHTFKPNSHCGFPVFIYDSEFVDEEKGFVKNNTIYLQIELQADEPVKLAKAKPANGGWTSKSKF